MQAVSYPYYPQQQFSQQVRPTYQDSYAFLKGRPVASMDEARASMIDFDGSVFYFPDTANNRIYSKQFNVDGSASFKVYELIDTPTPAPVQSVSQPENLVTKQEFEETINDLLLKIEAAANHTPTVEAPAPVATDKPAAPPKQAYKF